MIFVVQKLLTPATLHLKIQECKEVRTVPDLCALLSQPCAHLSSSLHIRPGRNPGSEILCSQGAGWDTGCRNRKTCSWATWRRGGSLFGRKCVEVGHHFLGKVTFQQGLNQKEVCVRECMIHRRGIPREGNPKGQHNGDMVLDMWHVRCSLTVSKSTTVRRK